MNIRIDESHIVQADWSTQGELVQTRTEMCINETTMEYGETDGASDESEVVQVLRVDMRIGRDRDCVVLQWLE